MPRWPAILLVCVPGCVSPVEPPVDSSPPTIFVEPPCVEPEEGVIALYFDGRVGLRLPPGVAAADLRQSSSHITVTARRVAVGCDRASVWIGIFEVDTAPTSLQGIFRALLRPTSGLFEPRLEFIRLHLDGFSIGVSGGRSSEPHHTYARVLRPSGDPARWHVIQFIVDSQDWEKLLPMLTASADSLARMAH